MYTLKITGTYVFPQTSDPKSSLHGGLRGAVGWRWMSMMPIFYHSRPLNGTYL